MRPIYKKCARCGLYSRMDPHHTICNGCVEAQRTHGRDYAEQRRKSLILYTPMVSYILTIRPLQYIYLPTTWKLSVN